MFSEVKKKQSINLKVHAWWWNGQNEVIRMWLQYQVKIGKSDSCKGWSRVFHEKPLGNKKLLYVVSV